jgi:hypothetical protein
MVPIENSNQVGIIAASTVSIFLATSLVALRLLAKRLGSGVDYSDYCIVLALVQHSLVPVLYDCTTDHLPKLFNTALHMDCILMVTHGGFGFHTLEVYARFGPDTATFFFKVGVHDPKSRYSFANRPSSGNHGFRHDLERHRVLQ